MVRWPNSLLSPMPCLMLLGCGQEPVIHGFSGDTMGSTYEVKFVGDTPVSGVRGIVTELLDDYDEAFSKWRDDSEIMRCNRAATTEPFAASPLFLGVLGRALELAAITEGAFDPTVEPLLRLYRQAKATGTDLDEAARAAAAARVGYRNVAVRDGAVHRAKAGIELDLDGIVAGACLDALAAKLREVGVPGFYLEITGEVYCGGEKAEGLPWTIGVVDPRSDIVGRSAPIATLPLRDRSLCTSGDYRNAIVSGGRIVGHIFDPRTGTGAVGNVVSASVLHESAAVADAVGTAMMVLGEPGAPRVVDALRKRGEIGVLLLIADESVGLRRVEFGWPEVGR